MKGNKIMPWKEKVIVTMRAVQNGRNRPLQKINKK